MANGQVFSKTDSGLLVPDRAAGDEQAVARLLKEYDPDLRLVPQYNGYRVYRYAGSDRPAQFVLYWGDSDGNAYPLSSRILDKVKQLDRNNDRSEYRSEDALNEERRKREAKRRQDEFEAIRDDWKSIQGRIPHMAGVRGKLR